MKQIKRFLSGLLVLCLLVSMIPVTVRAAESGTCGDNLTWTLSDDGILTISGTGPMYDYGYSGGPWGRFTSVVVEEGVTTIGACAFYRNNLLSSISLPEGLISIGGYAFYCCEALEEIKLPSTLTSIGHSSFYRCNGLEHVDIPYGVTRIPNDAFHGCRQLKTVNIPASVTTIGSYVFEYCDNLESVVIPDSVISIGDYAFGDCQNLTTITVGKNVTTVGMRVFAYNPKLATVYFRGSMPEFGCDYGFSEVKATVYYPSDDSSWNAARQKSYGGTLTWKPYTPSEHIYYSVVTAPTCTDDGYTTHTCTLCGHSYTDGYQPANGHRYDDGVVTAPGCGTEGYTTYTCTVCGDSYQGLYTEPTDHIYEAIVTDATCTENGYTTYLCSCGDSYVLINYSNYALGHSYEDGQCIRCHKDEPMAHGSCGPNLYWEIEDDFTLVIYGNGTMTDYASASEAPWYSHRASIRAIELEEGVTTVGDRAFYNCTALTDVSFSSTVSTIGTYAFRGCTALEAVTLPGTVTELKGSAFRACTSLTTVTFGGDAPTIGSFVFNDGAESLTVQRYEGTSGFDVAPWTGFTTEQLHVGRWIVDKEPSCTEEGSRHIDCAYCQKTITETLTGGHNYVDGICTICQQAQIVDSGSCGGNLTWKLDTAGTLTISGTGAMPYYYPASDVPWYAQRLSIKTIMLEEGVTRIGQYAFWGCSNLNSITIPDGVTEISYNAFERCSSLTSIVIPDSVTNISNAAFSGCTSLASVTIGNGVTSIANSVFYGCSSLESITIPDSVTSIEDHAFNGCSSLTSVYIPDSVTSIGWTAFSGCASLASITIPDSVTSIGRGAFNGCSGLESISIGSGITTIDYSVFNRCSSLTSIIIPDSVTRIGECAFENCTSLTNISIPDSVTQIGYSAFANCTSLAGITIPDSVTTIGGSAFYGCSGLASVTIGSGVTSMGSYVFEGCSSLESVTVRNGVTSLGDATFYRCSNLTSITIPGSVTGLGTSVFDECTSLTDVTIENGVTCIGGSAFYGCTSLTSIAIPDTVTDIGHYAFWGCSSLTNITIPKAVASIDAYAFCGCTGLNEITFEGNAPTFDSSTFWAVTTTCYYPAFNDTWTADVMQDYGGKITWVSRYMDPVKILTQPADFVGMVGEMAFFTVETDRDDVTYQWYFSADNGASWEKSSCIADTLKVEFKAYRLNYLYRCEVTDADGNTVVTDAAALSAMEMELVIVTQPENYVGAVNDDVTFTVEAAGNGLTYQWYYSDNGGTSWAKSGTPGFATSTLLPILRNYRDGYQYYCEITDIFGNTVTTDVVSMDVKASEIIITKQPENVVNAKQNELYAFDVEAEGDNLVYRWEFSNDGGATWQLSWNGGYNSPNLTVRMNPNRDGYLYRCCITSGLKIMAYSDAVMLDMQDPSVELIGQSGNVFVTANKTATFTVEAEGMDLTYLWYRSNDKGATWNQTYLSGYNTNTLSFVGNVGRAAMYMCKITDGSGTVVWSSPVKLQILSAELKILTQPEDVICANGETATFTVEAQGDSLKYQWYGSADGVNWDKSYLTGYNTDTFSFTVNATRAAKTYKCVITDVAGNTVETDIVSVTIN